MTVNQADTKSGSESGLDLSEKGRRDGEVVLLDRRLFMKFTAFADCAEPQAAIDALQQSGIEGVLYLDANDPRGVGLLTFGEDPELFVDGLRRVLSAPPFAAMTHKSEFDMLGRTYSIGYESDLEDTLLAKPRRRVLNPAYRWAVWYPLQRAKEFQTLPESDRRRVLGEHGGLAKRFGRAEVAADIRLACHGLDRNDNDFIIGLLGPELYPLSAVVQEMRGTEQTSKYLTSLGPFFVGRVAWQSGDES